MFQIMIRMMKDDVLQDVCRDTVKCDARQLFLSDVHQN